jgi:membrane protein implicated in regulation of membrane protease activity
MPDWVLWCIVAAAFAAGEIVTLGFFLGPVAVAALAAALVAGLGAGGEVQIAVFIVGSLASLALLRPVARRHLRTPPRLRTGAAALVGSQATVVDRVSAAGGTVRLRGEVWSARALDEERAIEPGERVHVMEIQGATAVVSD